MGVVGLASALGLGAGCSPVPAMLPNGLPKVARYTNATQVDWALSHYATVGASAKEAALRDESCLGWERMLFDLQSARLYPVILRQSTESANLANAWAELPALAARHPLPDACAQRAVPPTPKSEPGSLPAPAVTGSGDAAPVPEQSAVSPKTEAVAAAQGTSQATTGTAAGEGAASQTPAPSSPAAAPVESTPQQERRLLAKLRAAIGLPVPALGAGGEAASLRAEQIDYAVLTDLAKSDVPTIRLRARFHLLGLCTLAVESGDRFIEPPGVDPVRGLRCVGPDSASAPSRLAQRRLMRSMLAAWRAKYPEPMSDLVVALANFASRDNPVVDGPRVTR